MLTMPIVRKITLIPKSIMGSLLGLCAAQMLVRIFPHAEAILETLAILNGGFLMTLFSEGSDDLAHPFILLLFWLINVSPGVCLIQHGFSVTGLLLSAGYILLLMGSAYGALRLIHLLSGEDDICFLLRQCALTSNLEDLYDGKKPLTMAMLEAEMAEDDKTEDHEENEEENEEENKEAKEQEKKACGEDGSQTGETAA